MHGENMILLITMSFDDILECKTLEIFIMQPMLSNNNETNNSNKKKCRAHFLPNPVST